MVNPGFVRTPLTDKNDFPMPFLISSEQAAKHMVTALDRKRFETHFPLQLSLAFKLLRILPQPVFEWVIFKDCVPKERETMKEASDRQRIAVVGSGIAGVSAAYYLGKEHDVCLYESRERLGGHTHTVVVDDSGSGPVPVDTGFIVCKRPNVPQLSSIPDRARSPHP